MDVRRRPVKDQSDHHRSLKSTTTTGELLKPQNQAKASDALPLPLYLTNGLFFTMFFSVMYFLLHRWREKIRNGVPLHVVTLSELAALVSLIASVIYLVGFFGIDFVQSVIRPSPDSWEIEDDNADQVMIDDDKPVKPCGQALTIPHIISTTSSEKQKPPPIFQHINEEDEEIVKMVVGGNVN